jgi:hypothetical protein
LFPSGRSVNPATSMTRGIAGCAPPSRCTSAASRLRKSTSRV